jgi:hypothetical protein
VEATVAPIALTDEQLDAVFRAARPLAPRDRDPFLQDMAAALQGIANPGDGDIHRAIRTAQRRHWDPPLETVLSAPRPRQRVVARPE